MGNKSLSKVRAVYSYEKNVGVSGRIGTWEGKLQQKYEWVGYLKCAGIGFNFNLDFFNQQQLSNG